MERVMHETCIEYFQRRLSEGWKCISLEGYNAVLQSPEGIIRPIDLRNDVETLRPSGVGDVTTIPTLFGAATHWEAVDDAGGGDDDATYVEHRSVSPGWLYDLYALANTALVGETINSVTIYIRCRIAWPGNLGQARTVIKTNAVEYRGTPVTLSVAYGLSSKVYVLNPETEGAWTPALINALQPGVDLLQQVIKEWANPRCTQVYAEVDNTPVVAIPRYGFVNFQDPGMV